jgi:hypothetical protein
MKQNTLSAFRKCGAFVRDIESRFYNKKLKKISRKKNFAAKQKTLFACGSEWPLSQRHELQA